MIELECVLLSASAKVPYKSRSTDAAYDIYSSVDAILPPKLNLSTFDRLCNIIKKVFGTEQKIVPSEVNVPTGIALSCPSGYYYTIDGRSGLGFKSIEPFRGVIDAGYTGELMVLLRNYGNEEYHIKKGDRIAQICLHEVIEANIKLVDSFSDEYVLRGTAGFGSSGR